MELTRLFYVSTAAFATTESDAAAIAEQSGDRNKIDEITGAMAFNGVNFAQILEGPTEKVYALLERIKQDRRHSGLIVVSEQKVRSRKYDDWIMDFASGTSFDGLLDAMHT